MHGIYTIQWNLRNAMSSSRRFEVCYGKSYFCDIEVSFVERLSFFQRGLYRKFHCTAIHTNNALSYPLLKYVDCMYVKMKFHSLN